MDELNGKFAALHKEFDALPPDLPEFGETRAKFYSASVSLGTLGSKLPWLGERIDAAAKAANRTELSAITKDIAATSDQIRQIDKVSLELLHQVLPFKKAAAERKEAGKNACENPTPLPPLMPSTAVRR
jgi:hypothetical protein